MSTDAQRMSAPLPLRLLLLGAVMITAAGCMGMDPEAVSSLRALRIQVIEHDGYLLRSEDGWSARFAALPLSAREEYQFRSATVPTVFLDMNAELNSRGYLLRVYDARALDDGDREALRVLAEQRVMESGEPSPPRITREGDAEVHDVVITNLVNTPYHSATLRTFVLGGFVFEAVVIAQRDMGAPSDTRAFFSSIRLRPAAQ
jgi:hypothetical protein